MQYFRNADELKNTYKGDLLPLDDIPAVLTENDCDHTGVIVVEELSVFFLSDTLEGTRPHQGCGGFKCGWKLFDLADNWVCCGTTNIRINTKRKKSISSKPVVTQEKEYTFYDINSKHLECKITIDDISKSPEEWLDHIKLVRKAINRHKNLKF